MFLMAALSSGRKSTYNPFLQALATQHLLFGGNFFFLDVKLPPYGIADFFVLLL